MLVSNMSRSIRSPHGRQLLATGLVSAALIWAQTGVAQSGGPFARFFGSWRGSGQVIGADGNHERITCRAHYVISENGGALSQALSE